VNQLHDFVSAFTWKDALDFGLLFIIVYGALRVVKGTRAVPVLLAVAAFGFIAWAVNALDLIASASLLKYFFESIIILLIVVFQQELRRLLLYLGQRLLPASRREAAKSAVGELVAALDRLQRARVGVLVILQGDLPVMDIATGKGAEVGAPLRAETLVALAIPHAANTAHDGAILIEDFKITRAGVICPLSEQQLDPRFGTRHRGAIGCTEETDALALVLSEERGELRIAQGRVISEPIKVTELEERITEWLAAPRETWTRKPVEDEAAGETGTRADVTRTQMKKAEISSSGLEKSVKGVKPVEEAQ
jgi:DNA integrity scanning protein DisA with diadenylate cyclase activity